MSPFSKKQKADWQKKKHADMRAKGYVLTWVKRPPRYGTKRIGAKIPGKPLRKLRGRGR